MGPINPLALQEYDALQERHAFLQEQLDDVKEPRRDLRRSSRPSTSRSSTFAAAFADVSQNFESLFQTLFPGGRGGCGSPTPMTCSRPASRSRPSRRARTCASFAAVGWRAVAHRPGVPLRRVPQPAVALLRDGRGRGRLDDVNLHRFLDLVHEFREEAQLIIVSHQKRTMEAADFLYGVTMQPGGRQGRPRKGAKTCVRG